MGESRKMRVLWLCNIVFPELCDIFGFRRTNTGGWLTGMWAEMKQQSKLQLGICVPIIDKERMKDGKHDNYQFYSFWRTDNEELLETQVQRFCDIIEMFQPDIIHIWGTEYMHSLAMVRAAQQSGLAERVVVNIQGLIHICANLYGANIPQKVLEREAEGRSIKDEMQSFALRGRYETECLQRVKHVIGRTTWDRACVLQINPALQYHSCGEILRPEFYQEANRWNYEECEKHSIFISQAGYPIKGFHIFLKGLLILKEQFTDLKVYVAGRNLSEGKDAYAEYIRELMEEYQLTEEITFLGMLDAAGMCEYFRRCHVFVSPSVIENSSNSVCEALMIGIPVVASYVGGVMDFITHGENGYLYPYNEYHMMAYYVAQLFERRDEVVRSSGNPPVNRGIRNNEVSLNCEKNLEIYQKLLKE